MCSISANFYLISTIYERIAYIQTLELSEKPPVDLLNKTWRQWEAGEWQEFVNIGMQN